VVAEWATIIKMASLMGIPTVIQEQNSFPGITNKLLSKKRTLYVSLMRIWNDFSKEKMVLSGNQYAKIYLVSKVKVEAIQYFNLNESRKTLLVLGGSLGARRMNQLIEKELLFRKMFRLFGNAESYISKIIKNTMLVMYRFSLLERMDLVYAASDIVISCGCVIGFGIKYC
jgi:UDP-N-acetylglucosamine--N-acetylmuramyl-(pentapeptide) pyrophosphoryl-undecaprenol N-acetylglucosamine transferase